MGTYWKPGGGAPSGLTTEGLVGGAEGAVVVTARKQLIADLPTTAYRNKFLWALESHKVVIVVGETGSGKSTQLPQFIIDNGWCASSTGSTGNGTVVGACVAVVVPRRIAAVNLAVRVAQERFTTLGHEVGYRVRFANETTTTATAARRGPVHSREEETKLVYMTDGILMRELMSDPLLRQYSVVVLDDCHERQLNTDILLGLLKKILRRRRELRLVVTAATLDVQLIAEYFQDLLPRPNSTPANQSTARRTRWDTKPVVPSSVPVVPSSVPVVPSSVPVVPSSVPVVSAVCTLHIPGRVHPIDVHFLEAPIDDYLLHTVRVVLEIHENEHEGDILVFLTGKAEIESALEALSESVRESGSNRYKLLCLPLHAGVSAEHQLRVFAPTPPHYRKVVLSTAIAESSVTVPYIRFIIDCGFTKLKASYRTTTTLRCITDDIHSSSSSTDHSSTAAFGESTLSIGIELLNVTPVSQAAAKQRAGRCGRTAPGKCYRLYTTHSFDVLPVHTVPEIYRADLAETILYLKAVGVDNLLNFQFLTAPPTESVESALETLFALGAIDSEGDITVPGLRLAELPLPLQVGKFLQLSTTEEYGCSAEALTICAMTAIDTCWLPMTGVRTSRQLAVARRGLAAMEGDLVLLYNVMRQFDFHHTDDTGWTKRHMLSVRSMERAKSIRRQLSTIVTSDWGITPESCGDEGVERLLRAICAAFSLNACVRRFDGYTYSLLRLETSSRAHTTTTGLLGSTSKRDREESILGPVFQIHSDSCLAFKPPAALVFRQAYSADGGKQYFIKDVTPIDTRWLPQVAPEIYSAVEVSL